MPEFTGLSHVALSVRDRETSRAWYDRVLGFKPFDEVHEDAYDEWVLVHPGNHVILCLQQHRANAGEEFDPARTGGDHIALRVDSREDLEEWARWLKERDVDHSPVADREYGSVLCFRDPDRFQLELFYRPSHP